MPEKENESALRQEKKMDFGTEFWSIPCFDSQDFLFNMKLCHVYPGCACKLKTDRQTDRQTDRLCEILSDSDSDSDSED